MKAQKFVSLMAGLFVLSLLSGCLQDVPSVPKRVNMTFLVDPVGSQNRTIERNGNELVVSEVKLYLGSFILETTGEARLEANQGIILNYDASNSGIENFIFAGELGYDDFNDFNAFEYFVNPPPDSISVPDTDLVSGGSRYSIYMKGTYNGEDFEYHSSSNLNHRLTFETVSIGADKEILKLRIVCFVDEFLVDPQTQQILDPRESSNTDRIDQLLMESLDVEASSESTIPQGN
ncbi:MAG: hypothetical protein U5K31_04195 [Balneolaceae bacterium]|nr:hypothetical protein [Balneolaceae bacterium]